MFHSIAPEIGTTLPILPLRKLRLGEVMKLAQAHKR
jgi:hypothetical protein